MDILKVFLTAILSFALLFIITKVIGQKQLSQITMFDYINGITIGSIAAELATEIENPIKPVIAMIIYGLFNVLINIITLKSLKLRRFFSGSPIVLFENGHLYRENLKRAKLDVGDFLAQCRIAGIFDLSVMQSATMEHNGNISFLISADNRPVTPSDLSLKPPKEEMFTDVIMDGCVLEENMFRLGKDSKWLTKQLHAKNISSEKDVFLARVSESGTFQAYPIKKGDNRSRRKK